MSEWAACYTVDGPHAGRVYHYGTANEHLLIVGGFVWSYYVITDETVDTASGPVPAAKYYGTEPPPGAEPSPPVRRQPD